MSPIMVLYYSELKFPVSASVDPVVALVASWENGLPCHLWAPRKIVFYVNTSIEKTTLMKNVRLENWIILLEVPLYDFNQLRFMLPCRPMDSMGATPTS